MDAERTGDSGSARADRFDFERLERSVETLLKEHERLSAEREALLAELVEREHRITQLEGRLHAESERRAAAVDCVDRILQRVDALESSASEASAGGR